MAKRTLSFKNGTEWPESGIRSLDGFERPRLRLQGSILVLASSCIMSRRSRHQLRILENGPAPVALASSPNTWVLEIFAPLRRRLKYILTALGKMFGSCGSDTALAPH